jgi:hypothetical protein
MAVKTSLIAAIVAAGLFPSHVCAQRAVPAGGAGVRLGTFLDKSRSQSSYGQFGGVWGGGYPAYSPDRISPSVAFVIAQPQQPPESPPPPPPPELPAQPVMHQYEWPDAGVPPATAFSIVSKDGVVRLAIAVWVQDNALLFTATDGTRGQVALSTINREATDRLNADKHLKSPLPPGRY